MSDDLLSALGLDGPAAAPSPSAPSRPVQAKGGDVDGNPSTGASGDPLDAADRGVASASSRLPHGDVIQRAFGRHDVSGVRAQIGGPAAEASAALGAHAYATGDRVAFAQSPDLHTAAHEAAHVVQQAGGVQLKGGVGERGDAYERNADAVADAVVAGQSAETLLDPFAPTASASSTPSASSTSSPPSTSSASSASTTPSRSSSPASPASAAQRKAVQLVKSDYRSGDDIKTKLSLAAFDRYAKRQADWAISPTLGDDREPLRNLLAFARKQDGLVLSACRDFKVGELLALGIGQGTAADTFLQAYSRCAASGVTGTIHIESAPEKAADLIPMGEAILKLEKGIGGKIIEIFIPQTSGRCMLELLVQKNAVDAIIHYWATAKPLFDATNGRDVLSFTEFVEDGGFAKLGEYQAQLPEIRNYHRFTSQQLDLLKLHKQNAAANTSLQSPLPVCAVLHTALDSSGAFHRNSGLTGVIARVTHIVLLAEGKTSLAGYGDELKKFALYGKGQRLDEILLCGHGSSVTMKMAGDIPVEGGQDDPHYGKRTAESLATGNKKKSNDFLRAIGTTLRNHPESRLVLFACLTNSTDLGELELDPDPNLATKQILGELKKQPSLATSTKSFLNNHKGQVRGAHGSFHSAEAVLLDDDQRIDIRANDDQVLTAPEKLTYVEHGAEPKGVMSAALECWAIDRKKTMLTLKRRLATKGADKSWRERVICSLIPLILERPEDASFLQMSREVAGTLAGLNKRNSCSVTRLMKGVPVELQQRVFPHLTGAELWADESYDHVPLVILQCWMTFDPSVLAQLCKFIDNSGYIANDASELIHLPPLEPFLPKLLPPPQLRGDPPRSQLLLAVLFLSSRKQAAPDCVKEWVRALVGKEPQSFPPSCSYMLEGLNEHQLLVDSGAVLPSDTQATSQRRANVSPTGSEENSVTVKSLTQRGAIHVYLAYAYTLPSGHLLNVIPQGTPLHIIGEVTWKIGEDPSAWLHIGRQVGQLVPMFAVEYELGGHKTVFVKKEDLKVLG